jgi:hypothetical protein
MAYASLERAATVEEWRPLSCPTNTSILPRSFTANSKAALGNLHLNMQGLSKHALTRSLENQKFPFLRKNWFTRKGYNAQLLHDLKGPIKMEPTGKRDSNAYSKKMTESKDELTILQEELNNLIVRFVLRALRIYQSTRPELLRVNEIALLVRNEIKNVLTDLTDQTNTDNIAKLAKEAWAKENKP